MCVCLCVCVERLCVWRVDKYSIKSKGEFINRIR